VAVSPQTDQVFAAIAAPSRRAKWLLPTDFKPQLGFRFRFEGLTRGKSSTVQGQVIELEEASRLSYTWDDGEDDAPGVVSWTLTPKDGGTHLTLEHTVAEPVKPYVLIEASMNWRHAMHASLPALLRLLGEDRRPKAPIVYVADEPEDESKPKRRAGFRQEETACPL
jgi:uncharacterized protein YndB with AHSA1/START domain